MSDGARTSLTPPLHLGAPARPSIAPVMWAVTAFVLMALSSFVQQEPAPYDLLLIPAMLGFVFSGAPVPARLAWPALCILMLLTGYVIGTMFAVHREDAVLYLRTSAYLSVSLLFFAALIWRFPERIVPALLAGLLVSSAMAAILGIAGYFNAFEGAEAFAVYGRATGPFKDPNVFAPSLTLPVLYTLLLLATRPSKQALWILPLFLLFALALFLSFSRGAWLNGLIALIVFVGLSYGASPPGARTRLLTLILVASVLAAGAILWALSVEEVRSLFAERVVLAQTYDVEQGGRFASMRAAFLMALERPLGIGPYQWPYIWGLMPHNIYVNVFVSGGLLSLFGFAGLTIGTLWIGFRALKFDTPFRQVLILALAVFVGHAIQGFTIDTNHWRHLYVAMALVWGLALAADGARLTSRR